MAKIWVVTRMERLTQDLSPLLNFGEIRFVNSRFVYGDELDEHDGIPDQLWDPLVEAAEEFDPDKDFLAIAGDHLQVVQMAALLARKGESFRVLRYDRVAEGYFPVLIEFED